MSLSTPFPLLRSDHKILGSEYCSGYSDVFGKWNTGFYCPQSESKTAVSCCGTPTYKYCCTARDPNEDVHEVILSPYLIRTPVIVGIVSGVFLVLLLIIITSCYVCSCCFVYKKRRAHLPGGLYRMPLASSSTTSALMNTYSTSSNFSANTLPNSPLDADWTQFQPNYTCNNTGPTNISVRTSFPPNNLSGNRHMGTGSVRSDFQNGFLNADLLQQYFSAQNLQNQNNRMSSTLPRYSYHNQNQNQRPPGALSGNNATPERPPQRNSVVSLPVSGSNHQSRAPQSYIGYTISAESRPYFISANLNSPIQSGVSGRPRSVISLRNNIAYITSTLPLSSSVLTGRRTVHFHDTNVANRPVRSNLSPQGEVLSPPNLISPQNLLQREPNENVVARGGGGNEAPSVSLPLSVPAEPLKVVGPKVTSPEDTCEGDLKLTSGLSSPTIGSVGVTGGATGDETTGRISDKDLFTSPMTVSTAFGLGPDTEPRRGGTPPQKPNLTPPTSALPAAHPRLFQGPHGEEPEEPHYKVISSVTTSPSPTPQSIVTEIPNGKSTTLTILSNSSTLPVETHRILL